MIRKLDIDCPDEEQNLKLLRKINDGRAPNVRLRVAINRSCPDSDCRQIHSTVTFEPKTDYHHLGNT
jgi:hypothetical protein